MKITNSLISLVLGVTGGLIAFLVTDVFFAEKETSGMIKHEIVGPGIAHSSVRTVDNNGVVAVGGSVDFRDAAKKSVPAVVHVKTIQMGREYVGNPFLDYWFGSQPQTRDVPRSMGFGSGVIISEDGYIITNNHVIDGSDKVSVTLNDKRIFEAQIVGKDPNTDIALLKIDAKELPYLEYGNSDDVVLGEWVLAVGNPYNLTSTVTAGIISAKARELGINRGQMNLESFLQTDAAVNPGNSGGALVNTKGELVGINTAIESQTGAYSGYSFAVPVNIARKIIGDLKDYGKAQRAVVGIRMGEMTPAVAEELGLAEKSGIYVAEVIKGGAAERAEMKEGDVIKSVNDIAVKTVPEFQEQLAKYRPGVTVRMVVNRKGEEKVLEVVLQNTYGDTAVAGKEDFGVLGTKVEPLSKNDRYRYRLNKGVKIKEIKNGKFKAAGLSEGYIIVKINDRIVYDENDMIKALKDTKSEGVFVTAVSPQGHVEYFAFSLSD